ncbi:MAG TPA: RHS repeat-associated core domain-containing protein, partial [Acidimicrobiales bacterium]|nr:RHS repeat-associated core domain-containing protein [Acidimicrobiales bacterium]
DTSGLRSAKELETADGTGVEARQEHTWTAAGGLPLLLAEHQGSTTSYLVYGPGGTPIYQINHTGEVIYLHQDHQGSTRLVTNANGTVRGAMAYDAHGAITVNTNPWYLQQPMAGYTGQYHDTETGYIYLRARYYDPVTGQFTSSDPLVALTEEPYGYGGGNPVNWWDPSGLVSEDYRDTCERGNGVIVAGLCTDPDNGQISGGQAGEGLNEAGNLPPRHPDYNGGVDLTGDAIIQIMDMAGAAAFPMFVLCLGVAAACPVAAAAEVSGNVAVGIQAARACRDHGLGSDECNAAMRKMGIAWIPLAPNSTGKWGDAAESGAKQLLMWCVF